MNEGDELRRIVVGLGSNLGSREALVRAGGDLLGAVPGITVQSRSKIHCTEPWGPPQPEYFNAAVLLHTTHTVDVVFSHMRRIETWLGRERRERWGPRTLDLDILWAEGISVQNAELTVPHPGLLERGFALGPLLEVCPDALDPRTHAPLSDAFEEIQASSQERSWDFSTEFPIEVLDHTADEGFRVEGMDRSDAIAAASEALGALIVAPASVRADTLVPVSITAPAEGFDDDERVFAWLSEVLYYLDARRFALRRAVIFADDATGVRGALVGEPLDESRHEIHGALKAVTYHALQAGVVDSGRYGIQVVVDV